MGEGTVSSRKPDLPQILLMIYLACKCFYYGRRLPSGCLVKMILDRATRIKSLVW